MRYAIAALTLATGAAFAQSATLLEPGRPVSGSIAAGESHEFSMELDAGRFVYGEVLQHDVDVRITVYDPDGKVAGNFDGSARGADPLQLDTQRAGRYRIELKPFEEQSGDYTILIERNESSSTDPERRLDQLLSQFTGDDVPGGIVAVVRNGEIVHAQSVGMANLVHGVPFERDTVSNIGSVSKQFTAFAVTQLAVLGEISLDDDVRDYFPELPDHGQTVTVRHLLNHTSGYREFLNLLGMAGRGIGQGDYIDRDELIEILMRQPSLQEEPGQVFNYNNTAYGLAALLVERVTEVPFPEWMADNVFDPVGMSNTRVRSHLGEVVPGAADGYVYADDSPFRQAGDLGGGGGSTMGAGAVYSTVDDLARWMGNLESKEVGGAEVIDEMTRPQIEQASNAYGLGLSISNHRGLELISHGGADIAHRAMLLYYPEINAGVISLSNNGAFSGSVARKTAEAFFAADMEPEAAPDSAPGAETAAVDAAVFDPHLGKYELDDFPGVVLNISRDGDQLFLTSAGGEPVPVSPASTTVISLPPDQRIEFHVADDGAATGLTLHGTNELRARRLAAWEPHDTELAAYVGRYFSDELETFYTVAMGDEGLEIHHRRLDDIELTPKTTDSFNGGFPAAEVSFTRAADGAIDGMLVSSVRTRDVRFDRQD